MDEFIFSDSSIPYLKKGMDVYDLRQKVIANNIANLTTHGFQTERVKFEEILSSELKRKPKLQGRNTHPDHLPIGRWDIRGVRPRIVKVGSGYFNGINDVNVDSEMADMAKTTIAFDAAAKLLYVKYQILEKSVRGR